MKHNSITFTICCALLAGAAAAQDKAPDERAEPDPCRRFEMKVQAPPTQRYYKLKVTPPSAGVEFSGRVRNPCGTSWPITPERAAAEKMELLNGPVIIEAPR